MLYSYIVYDMYMKIVIEIVEPLSTETVENIITSASMLESLSISYMGINGNFEMLTLIQAMNITGEFELDIDGNKPDIDKALEILKEFDLLKHL